jgi:hypothetical protein
MEEVLNDELLFLRYHKVSHIDSVLLLIDLVLLSLKLIEQPSL